MYYACLGLAYLSCFFGTAFLFDADPACVLLFIAMLVSLKALDAFQ